MKYLKHSVSLLLVVVLTLIAPLTLAEPTADFGLTFLEFGDRNLAAPLDEKYKIHVDSLDVDFDTPSIRCGFGPGLTGEYTVRPSNGNITGACLTTTKIFMDVYSIDFKYCIEQLMPLIIDDIEALTTATDRLGLADEAIYEKDTYSAEVRLDGLCYKMDIDGNQVAFEVYIISEDTPENTVSQDDAEHLLNSIMAQCGIEDYTYFAFDEETDTNALFGVEGYYGSKVNFALNSITGSEVEPSPKIEVYQGGAIEVFENKYDAEMRRSKLVKNGYVMPEFAELTLCRNNIVLRLSPNISSEMAGKIIGTFYSMDL